MFKPKSTLCSHKFHLLWALCSLVLLFGLTAKAAQAHADIIRAEPIDGQVLENAPTQLRFWFNEPILPQFSLVQLVDDANRPVANVQVQPQLSADGALVVTLPDLAPGVYTVMWRVLSDVDGHLSQGFTLFSSDPSLAPTTSLGVAATRLTVAAPALPIWGEAWLRWGNYMLLAALVGALALVWLVLVPVDKQPDAQSARQQQRLYRRMLRWAATCAAAAFVVGIGMLFWQVASFQTLATAQASWFRQARLVLLETQWGLLWLTRQGLLIFLSGGLLLLASRFVIVRSSWLQLLVFGRAIDLMIVQALTGHATSESHNWLLALTSATLHLLAAGAWIGGLVALVVIVLPAWVRHKTTTEQWRPLSWRAFSRLAALSVAMLFATGLFNMGRQVASIDALMDSAYGRFLLGKLGLVLFVALCGIVNTCLLHPKLAHAVGRLLGRSTQLQPLRRSFPPGRLIALEVMLGVLLFGITGFITATSPPRDVAYTIDPAQIQKSLTQRVDDLLITLEVSPNRLGQNLINIRAVNPARPMSADILQLYVQLAPVQQRAEPITILAEKIDTDQFQVIGNHLTLAGPWRIGMRIQRYGRPDLTAHFEWIVPPAGELQPVRISKAPLAPLLNRLVIGFLIGLVLILGGWRWFIQRQNRLRATQNADMKSDLLAPTLPAAQKP